mgnify:CR=1 FL=1
MRDEGNRYRDALGNSNRAVISAACAIRASRDFLGLVLAVCVSDLSDRGVSFA